MYDRMSCFRSRQNRGEHVRVASLLTAFVLGFCLSSAYGQIKIGVSLSATGPGASLGIPQKNTFALLPQEIAGQKVELIILDDASDTTTAVKNARRFVTEDKVDAIIGSTITPNSLAMIDVAAESETPMISLAANAKIVEPMDDKRKWVFKTAQNDSMMAAAVVQYMVANGVKSAGFIGYNDPYGEGWWNEFSKLAAANKIEMVASERFNRNDTSVTAQVLKLVAANPDAVLIAASGTPAALPQSTLVERGYKGKIYQTHGIANADFLRVGGKKVDGAIFPVGPMLVAEQLPDSHPSKKVGLDYIAKYEAQFGKGSRTTFGGHAWDAWILLERAIPVALKKAKPGTKEFRKALRDAIEGEKNIVAAHGVFNMTPTDHVGLDSRARVMARVDGGTWKLIGQ
jgi:branched-chain amino acid transport system substrate-binding protein